LLRALSSDYNDRKNDGVLMKVLFVHELFPPDVAGGGEIIAMEFAKRLREKGVDVEVLSTGNPMQTSFEGVPTHRIPVNRYLLNFLPHVIAKRARDFDMIQSFSFNASLPSYIASKLNKKPVVNFVLGVYGNQWKDMKGPVVGRIFSFLEHTQLVHDFDRTFFLSDFSRNVGIGMGLRPEKTDIIHPGVDASLFKPRKKDGSVLFVGRLAKQKGVDYLIEAARALPMTKFIVVGDGEEGSRLRKISPANVRFTGWLKPFSPELVELYSKASIFCLPSIGEGFGIVLLEAMASGCAVISTIPLDYEGIRVAPKDTKALITAISKLIEDPKRIESLGAKNTELSRGYDWSASAEKMKRIYSEIV
jgi:glycosyltransferase involved in cell wall biosynthesis